MRIIYFTIKFIDMKKLKIFISSICGLGMLVIGYCTICDFWHSDVVSACFWFTFFVCLGGLIHALWYGIPKLRQEELLFNKRYGAIEYAVKHKKGSKQEFCLEYGEEMYAYCLDRGFIHEPLNCDDNNVCWEVTHHAIITLSTRENK